MSQTSKLTYMGVPVDEIADSLLYGVQFLKEKIPAKDVQDTLAIWELNSPFPKLEKAQTPKEFEATLLKTETATLLGAFHDLFSYFALTEKQNTQTGGKKSAIEVYKNIAAWGGFDYPTEHPAESVQLENNSYLNALYARNIDLKDLQSKGRGILLNPKPAQRFQHGLMMRYNKIEDKQKADQEIGRQAGIWQQYWGYVIQSGPMAASGLFKQHNEENRSLIQEFSERVLGVHLRKNLLEALSPIKTYTIKPKKQTGSIEAYAEDLNHIIVTIKKVVNENLEQGHVRNIEVTKPDDPKTIDFNKIGIKIRATKEVAQIIASSNKALEVTDDLGRAIQANTGGPAANKGPAPQ